MNVHAQIMPVQAYDAVIEQIACYVHSYESTSDNALETARNCIIDSLGCAALALQFPECTKHLGPLVPGTVVPNGARVPGTSFCMDPVKAAWDIGCIIRWLDFNDTWLAAEWGHPSDNLGAILAVADFVSRQRISNGEEPLSMRKVLEAIIKAHEIQGQIAMENSFNRVGLCHVLLVRVASTAVACWLLGGDLDQIKAAVSHAWTDGGALRSYRHAPNACSRKSWAAGDATSRAVYLAMIAMRGETGIPSALTAKTWGFYDVLFKGKPFTFQMDFSTYVMENILFKISYPAEFHAQTACEAAATLHAEVKDHFDEIERIEMTTHESAIRIIAKDGVMNNPADRDHCLQYIAAVGLYEGTVRAEHYEDDYHQNNPRIDDLRSKMVVTEDKEYSQEYLDPDKRSIANAMQIFFKDGSSTEKIEVRYPIGHKRRREEGYPVLEEKFKTNIATQFSAQECSKIVAKCMDQQSFETLSVPAFMELFAR